MTSAVTSPVTRVTATPALSFRCRFPFFFARLLVADHATANDFDYTVVRLNDFREFKNAGILEKLV